MCGFAGILRLAPAARALEEDAAHARRMARQLSARGPDDERLAVDGPLTVAFRRLSIIDVAGGAQPLWSEDRRWLSVINGEIYNHAALRRALDGHHTLRTRSD